MPKCVCHINGYRVKDTEARKTAEAAAKAAEDAKKAADSVERSAYATALLANQAKSEAAGAVTAANGAANIAMLAEQKADKTEKAALLRTGGTMTGNLDMGGKTILNARHIDLNEGLSIKDWGSGAQFAVSAHTEVRGALFFCYLDNGSYRRVILNNVADPVSDYDAANKKFVVETIAAALEGLNVGSIGYVDGENNIIINTQLPAGEYSVRYEMEDGSTVEIGKLVLDEDAPAEPEEPTIVNLAEPNSDNTTDFSIWCNNARIGSDGAAAAREGYVSTNFFAVSAGDVIRFKNFQTERITFYDESKSVNPPSVGVNRPSGHITNGIIHEVVSDVDLTANANGEPTEMKFTIKDNTLNANIAYCRLSGHLTGTAADVMITANQEIE